MSKADEVDVIVQKIKTINEFIEELKQDRSRLLGELQEYLSIADIAHMIGAHHTTVGRMIGELK